MSINHRKIIIIGGGPAGLSAAIYNARAGLQPLVLAGSPPGGQLMLTSEVENFPGFSEILGPDLVKTIRNQAEKFGTEIIDENVLSVDVKNNLISLQTAKNKYETDALIITTGAKALWLGLDSETKFRGKGVSACATCDGFFFKDKTVAVVGGGDTAMEEAQTLTKFAKKIFLIHRRDSFRASKIMQERVLKNPKIEIIWNSKIEKIAGTNVVEGIEIRNLVDNVSKTIDVQGVFVAIGHKPDTDLFKSILRLDEKGYILTSAVASLKKIKNPNFAIGDFNFEYQTMTSAPGIFAGGDCVDHIYRQAGTAAGMGIAVSLDAERWLWENERK